MGSKDQAIQEINQHYQSNLAEHSDQRHLRLLKRYGEQCDSITEIGFRGGVSASAFLASLPKKFTAVDWDRHPFKVNRLVLNAMQQRSEAAGIQFEFISGDSLHVRLEPCDLLFIDSFHTYEHLFLELIRHHCRAQKFILLHDTDVPTCPGMFHAVEDFLLDNSDLWDLEARHRESPGLTILRRKAPDDHRGYPRVVIRTLELAVARQKEMYYSQIDQTGSSNQQWHDWAWSELMRFSDRERWPLANKSSGATEMVASYQSRQTES